MYDAILARGVLESEFPTLPSTAVAPCHTKPSRAPTTPSYTAVGTPANFGGIHLIPAEVIEPDDVSRVIVEEKAEKAAREFAGTALEALTANEAFRDALSGLRTCAHRIEKAWSPELLSNLRGFLEAPCGEAAQCILWTAEIHSTTVALQRDLGVLVRQARVALFYAESVGGDSENAFADTIRFFADLELSVLGSIVHSPQHVAHRLRHFPDDALADDRDIPQPPQPHHVFNSIVQCVTTLKGGLFGCLGSFVLFPSLPGLAFATATGAALGYQLGKFLTSMFDGDPVLPYTVTLAGEVIALRDNIRRLVSGIDDLLALSDRRLR